MESRKVCVRSEVMWVNEAPTEQLAVMIEHCAALKLVSGPNGEILYANAAFREWSEYSLFELKAIGWKKLSVENDSLNADIEAVKQVGDGYIQSYTVRKQYRTKSGTAHWGNLSVIRYPAAGDIQCFFCVWEPFKNGTSTAFAMAMENYGEITKRLEAMTTEISVLSSQTEEEKFGLSGFRMARRHPKVVAAFVVIALSIFGLNNVVELLQRTGLIQLPVKIERTEAHASLVHEIANPVRVVAVASEYSTTIGDRTVSITKYDDGRSGPVSVTAGRGNTVWNRIGSGFGEFTGQGRAGHGAERRIDDVSNDAHVGNF